MGINVNGSDRIVRPTFSSAELRPATLVENLGLAFVSFGTAGLMLWGAVDFGRWIYSLLR